MQLRKLLSDLDLGQELNWDWFILLVAKTGMRFSEALAITPQDFDFSRQSLSINKTWDYKGKGGFLPTKNQSSVRKIQIDWQLIIQFSTLVKGLPQDEPIFISGNVYNSTVNDILTRHCKKAGIPVISVHGLRHTHASLLLFAGVSIASVAQRLGHSSMTNGIQDYVDGYTHEGEFILVAEDGANDLKNYPVKCVKGRIWVNNHAHVLQGKNEIADNKFLAFAISQADIESLLVGGGRAKLNAETLMEIDLLLPVKQEQVSIGNYFTNLDNLITLHQRECFLSI